MKRIRKGATAPYIAFRCHGYHLYLNVVVREALRPAKYVSVEVDDDLSIILKPSEDPRDYKISQTQAVTLISSALFFREFPEEYKEGKHIPAEIMENGTVVCRIQKGANT